MLTLLAHYGGIDEMAIILVPLVMVLGLWVIFRGGDPQEGEPPGEDKQ